MSDSGGGNLGGDLGGDLGGKMGGGLEEDYGPSNMSPEAQDPESKGALKELENMPVTYEQSDIDRLSAFDVPSVNPALVDRGLATQFEFQIPETMAITSGWNQEGSYEFLSPTMYKEITGKDYDPNLVSNENQKAVQRWLKEMEANRTLQYSDWTSKYGQYLGGAGTQLASKFGTEEAQLSKQTLLGGTDEEQAL